MTDCLHLKLSKLSDTVFLPFKSYKEGWRWYRCQDCNQMLKAKETRVEPKRGSTTPADGGKCMRNPNGPSIEEQEAMQEQLEDLNEIWRNKLCSKCGLARKIVVHSDTALDEFHRFED